MQDELCNGFRCLCFISYFCHNRNMRKLLLDVKIIVSIYHILVAALGFIAATPSF
jgi:hypothetical protein